MSRKLYERCEQCEGTRKTVAEMLVNGKPVPAGSRCEFCGTGFHEIGMTVGQLEAVMNENERLLEFVARVATESAWNHCTAEGAVKDMMEEAARLVEGKAGRVAEIRRKMEPR